MSGLRQIGVAVNNYAASNKGFYSSGRFDNRPGALPACTQQPTHNACRASTDVQRTAALSGSVWLDAGPDRRQLDSGDRRLPGWTVELVDPATGRVIASTTTGPDGRYRFTDLEPGVPMDLRFRDPASGEIGRAHV